MPSLKLIYIDELKNREFLSMSVPQTAFMTGEQIDRCLVRTSLNRLLDKSETRPWPAAFSHIMRRYIFSSKVGKVL
jgi:hypothetical protein